jgi:phosphoenolpyruvate synthase/pyruvate phosphate dikinase
MNLETVKKKYEEQLMKLPNVMGVSIGEKGGKKVIKVFVTRKLPAASLRSEEIIPETLEGFEVDVEEIGNVTWQT